MQNSPEAGRARNLESGRRRLALLRASFFLAILAVFGVAGGLQGYRIQRTPDAIAVKYFSLFIVFVLLQISFAGFWLVRRRRFEAQIRNGLEHGDNKTVLRGVLSRDYTLILLRYAAITWFISGFLMITWAALV